MLLGSRLGFGDRLVVAEWDAVARSSDPPLWEYTSKPPLTVLMT